MGEPYIKSKLFKFRFNFISKKFFQGLPHCHLLLILDEQDKPRTPEDIDKIVCAEIPDPIETPQLYATVTSSMNHGLCGSANLKAKCMIDDKCSKYYPKEWQPTTIIENDGYPKYRRRNDQRFFITSRGERCDNRHIVPCNKALCTMFNCHINVEICNSVQAIKYIHKYIYKGT